MPAPQKLLEMSDVYLMLYPKPSWFNDPVHPPLITSSSQPTTSYGRVQQDC